MLHALTEQAAMRDPAMMIRARTVPDLLAAQGLVEIRRPTRFTATTDLSWLDRAQGVGEERVDLVLRHAVRDPITALTIAIRSRWLVQDASVCSC